MSTRTPGRGTRTQNGVAYDLPMSTGGPQAGWYDIGDGVERRHDGTQWTDERRPLGTETAPAGPAANVDHARDDMDALTTPAPEDATAAPTTGPRAWMRERKVPLLVLGGIAALAVGGFALSSIDSDTVREAPTASKSPLFEAVTGCGMTRGAAGLALGDNDSSLILDGKGDDDLNGVTVERQACVLTALDIPDSTLNLMSTTRALDGRQQGSWNDYDASWSYHPDTGLNITIESR